MTDTVVIVPDFVSVVGSFVENPERAHDIDVLFRCRYDQETGEACIPHESLMLAVRDWLREHFGSHGLGVHSLFNPTGPHQGKFVPVADLVLRMRESVEREEIKTQKPAGWPPKPSVAFYTEHFSPDELWERWGKSRAPFAAEPKLNGWRALVVKSGESVTVFFEGDGKNYAPCIQPLAEQIRELSAKSIVLDGDLGVKDRHGVRWARKDLAALRTCSIDWRENSPVFCAFDVLEVDGEDLTGKPFRERRMVLLRVAPQFAVPQMIVRDLSELRTAYEKFSALDQSEGLVCKTLDAPYPTGATNEWSKIKNRLEVKARVVERRRLKNGAYVYLCEWGDGVRAGWTMPTTIEATVGDVITVAVQEINVGRGVTWQNGSVIDVDPGARPYSSGQAVHLAQKWLKTFRQSREEQKANTCSAVPYHVYGGKYRVAPKLIPRFPSHRIYCEPFAGAAGVLFRKPPSETEVLNDLDSLKIRALRFLKNGSEKAFRQMERRLGSHGGKISKQEYLDVCDFAPRSDADAYYKIAMLTAFGYLRADSGPHDYTPKSRRYAAPTVETMLKWHERLRNVTLRIGDALECIAEFDSPDTFFFIDPPYPTAVGAGGIYRIDFTAEQFRELIEALKRIRGKFMLTCRQSDLSLVELPRNWRVKRYALQYSTRRIRTRPTYEVMVMNYPQSMEGGFLKQVAEAAGPGEEEKKSVADEESGTRASAAIAAWEKKWESYYPEHGRGTFVAHAHLRGLSEDELGLDLDELIRRGHSVHVDLRFTTSGDDVLWGITVFAPEGKLPLDELAGGEPVQATPKLPEPYEWLDVAKDKPYIAEPGEVGATSRSYARIDELDRGEYEAGVWNRHSVELFLNGKRLRGRFLFRRIGETWTLQRHDGPPISEQNRQSVAERLRARGHNVIIWRSPGGGEPERIVLKGRFRFPESAQRLFGPLVRWIARLVRKPHLPYMVVSDWIVLIATNAFRDVDGAIVSTDAIREFMERPSRATVRFYHLPGTDFADVVAFVHVSRTLIAVAKFRDNEVGRFFRRFLATYQHGHDEVAPVGWGTSVGFSVRFDDRDMSVINRFVVREISVVPLDAASNPWTVFLVEPEDARESREIVTSAEVNE